MIVKSVTACLGFVCLAHLGHAQVVSGFSHLQGPDYAFHNETAGAPGVAIPEIDVEVYGMAADDATSTVYIVNESAASPSGQLLSWTYGASAPTVVGPILDPAGMPIRVDGLALDPANPTMLYVAVQFQTPAAPFGLYTLDITASPLQLSPVFTFTGTTAIGAIGFNLCDGKLYGADDVAGSVVKIDPVAMTVTNLSRYPEGCDFDGATVGDNKLYIVQDDVGGPIEVYNIGTGMWETPLPSNCTNPAIITGACWAPGLFNTDPGGCALGPIGQNFECPSTVPNSSGQPGVITASGSTLVAANNVTLDASQLPAGQFGYFLVSPLQNLAGFNPPGSSGLLCIGPAQIGRYNGNVGQGPSFSLMIDLTALPTPDGTESIMPGDTRYFTCWYRDGATNNNYTDAVCITFN